MNTTTLIAKNTSREKKPMSSLRKTSLAAGLLYLLSFISIPTLALYSSIHSVGYVLSSGPDRPVIIGGILEIIVALACIGTAVMLYPVIKKQHEGIALGLVASRILEAGTIFLGVAFLLSVVTLRQAGAGSQAGITSQALVAMYDRIFLLGQSFLPAVNALLLGYLFYHSRLVPRVLPVIAFTGATLLVACDLALLFGFIDPHSPLRPLAAIPIAVWEFSLGIYLVVKGFKRSPITEGFEQP
jgi:hypothetical protein